MTFPHLHLMIWNSQVMLMMIHIQLSHHWVTSFVVLSQSTSVTLMWCAPSIQHCPMRCSRMQSHYTWPCPCPPGALMTSSFWSSMWYHADAVLWKTYITNNEIWKCLHVHHIPYVSVKFVDRVIKCCIQHMDKFDGLHCKLYQSQMDTEL